MCFFWQALDQTELCAHSTAHGRFQVWVEAGVFLKLWQAGVEQFDELCGIEWDWLAMALLAASGGGTQLNAAFPLRLNATFGERLASLTRRCCHTARKVSRLQAGMWLVGCTYNFCWPHHELSRRAAKSQDRRGEVPLTPAMASSLTDHVWSVRELLTFRVPPAWLAPKRRGRPLTGTRTSKASRSVRPAHLRPVLRLRKGVLCLSTS